jgi:transposase
MESTGVYWKPVWNALEKHFPLILANPYQVKSIPTDKTDPRDAEWIADLLGHGLIRPSFAPPREIRELRDLTRHRVKLVHDRNRVHNRTHKVLEDARLTAQADWQSSTQPAIALARSRQRTRF